MAQENNDKMKKDPDKVPTLAARKNVIQVLKKLQVQKNKKQVRVGKPPKGSRAHRSKLGSWGTNKIYYIGIIPLQQEKNKINEEEAIPPPWGGSYGNKILYKNLDFFDKIFVRKSVCKS